MPDEHFQTGMKKGRGRAQQSLDIIKAMHDIAEIAQPITGRGVGYKLFSLNLIPSMSKNDMQRVENAAGFATALASNVQT